jgi:hypothetical protein
MSPEVRSQEQVRQRQIAEKILQQAIEQIATGGAPAHLNLFQPDVPIHQVYSGYGSDETKVRLVESLMVSIDGVTPILLQELHETSTVGQVLDIITNRLAVTPAKYCCTFVPRTHYYLKSQPTCTYDGTPVVIVP